MEGGGWSMEGGGWSVEYGGWRVEGGGRSMEGGGWSVEGLTAAHHHPRPCRYLDRSRQSRRGPRIACAFIDCPRESPTRASSRWGALGREGHPRGWACGGAAGAVAPAALREGAVAAARGESVREPRVFFDRDGATVPGRVRSVLDDRRLRGPCPHILPPQKSILQLMSHHRDAWKRDLDHRILLESDHIYAHKDARSRPRVE